MGEPLNSAKDGASPRPIRTIHLQGGSRACELEGYRFDILPAISKTAVPSFAVADYGAVYSAVKGLGLQIVGADFYSDMEQIDGRRLPDWRSYHRQKGTSWPCADQADEWNHLAYAAFRVKNGLLWDIASRVSHQLRTCDWRMRELSACYCRQLEAKLKSGDFHDGVQFMDGFTWLGYLSIQSFLVDACVLRDYLAEYRALLLSQSGVPAAQTKITRMSTLKKNYLDKGSLQLEIDRSLKVSTDTAGWLLELGDYRDLVVHYAPLASAKNSLFALCQAIPLRNADSSCPVPTIKLPIPVDPGQISKDRHSGVQFDDPEMNYARFTNILQDAASARDGLLYSHSCLEHLAILASDLLEISPIRPEMPHFTDKDFIDVKILKSEDRPRGS